jgi:hypothetical protein
MNKLDGILGVQKRTEDLSISTGLEPYTNCGTRRRERFSIKLLIQEDICEKMREKQHHTTFLASLFILEYLIGSSYL